ncbi:MAG: hypothetical protein K8S98_09220 [Planctomycetes bacterium]|nr:hypothetical protein [Planctomycetota bacterium]
MKNVVLAVVTAVGLSSCFSFDFRVPSRLELMADCRRMDEACDELTIDGVPAALMLDDDCERCCAVAERLSSGGVRASYWIDVARAPTLADAHPEWMLEPGPANEQQTSRGWLRVPRTSNEVVEAQVERMRDLLAGLPTPERVYLSGLQRTSPRADGSTTIGPRRSAADSSGPDDSAMRVRFVEAVRALAPTSEVVPVLTYDSFAQDATEPPEWISLAAALANSGSRIGVAVPLNSPLGVEGSFDRLRRDLGAYCAASVATERFVFVLEFPTDAPEGTELPWQGLFTVWNAGVEEWVFALGPLERPIEARPAPLAGP